MTAPETGSPSGFRVPRSANLGGLLFRWLVSSSLWRNAIYELTRHFPPSGSELTVLDVSAGDTVTPHILLHHRADLRILALDTSQSTHSAVSHDQIEWIVGTLDHFPLPDNSVDAVTAHGLLLTPNDRQSFLRESLRVLRPGGRIILLSIAPDRSMMRLLRPNRILVLLSYLRIPTEARLTLEQTAQQILSVGFERVLTEQILDNCGILSRGEKPYTYLSTVERIAQTASREVSSSAQIVDAQSLESASRGRFVFLLVRQSPDKPVWALHPGEVVRWQAAMISDGQAGGKPYLLAFTSLSRAVEFMQSAVTTGTLHGVNKVAKFPKSAAPAWDADLFLNPSFETLHASERYAFNSVQLDVDPRQAVSGEE